jgi:hypothetical protein
VGRTTTAIAWVTALLMVAGCGGEVSAMPQRATSDGGANAPSAPEGGDGSSDGVAGVPDAQSDAALEADGPAALTGPPACAAGAQCVVSGCRFETLEYCGLGAMCCLDMLCAADASAPIIRASDYDQSCALDSDCVEVHVGNRCTCALSCQTDPAAINKGALAQFTADVANLASVFCNCLPPNPNLTADCPRCIGGTCQFTTCY